MSNFRGVAAVLALTLGGGWLAYTFWRPAPTPPARLLAGGDVPVLVDGYRSTGDRPPDAYTQMALPGASILARTYARPGDQIDFILISGTSREALHDPRLCLTGSLRLSDSRTDHLPGTSVEMQTYQAADRPGPPDTEVAYFYVYNGRVVSNPTQIRTALLWSALLGRQSSPVYFFRFIHPLGAGAVQGDHARLEAFATQMWQSVQGKLGGAMPAQIASAKE